MKATAQLVGGSAGTNVAVTLTSAGTVGGLVFDAVRSDNGAASLALTLPGGGQPVAFWVAGEFQKQSSAYGDAVVQVKDKTTRATLGSKAVMVRIRKNAQTLSASERDRYLAALGTLNAQGQGAFRDFREMHFAATTRLTPGRQHRRALAGAIIPERCREHQQSAGGTHLPTPGSTVRSPRDRGADAREHIHAFQRFLAAPTVRTHC